MGRVGEKGGGRDDAKIFGLSSWKSSQAPLRGLLTSFNCPQGPAAKVKTETEGGTQPCSWLWGSGDRLHILVIPLPFIYWPYWLLSFPHCLLSGEKTINVMD